MKFIILSVFLFTISIGNAQTINVKNENPYEIYVDPSPLETYMGHDIETNEGKQFCYNATLLCHSVEKMSGEWCISFWKGGTLIKSYPPFSVEMTRAKLYFYSYPCWIDVPAGDYEVRPLFKKEGDSFWTMPDPDTSTQRGWKYKFLAENSVKAPSCSYFFPKNNIYPGKMVLGATNVADNFYTKPAAGNPIDMEYHIINKNSIRLTGELVAFYERDLYEFTAFDDYYLAEKNPEIKWKDEVGSEEVTLAPGEKLTGNLTIRPTFHAALASYPPMLNLYFRQSGSSELIRLRDNCDSMFSDDNLVKKELLEKSESLLNGMEGTFNFIFVILPFEQSTTGSQQINPVKFNYQIAGRIITLSDLNEGSDVYITSLIGNTIQFKKSGTEAMIDMSKYPSGIYILSVKGKQKQTIKLFIK